MRGVQHADEEKPALEPSYDSARALRAYPMNWTAGSGEVSSTSRRSSGRTWRASSTPTSWLIRPILTLRAPWVTPSASRRSRRHHRGAGREQEGRRSGAVLLVEGLGALLRRARGTRYHDSEYRVNSGYIHYDGQVPWRGEGAQDLDLFLDDKESLLDEDLVAWICVGKEHIVRSEDLPLVSNFGSGFSLVPWNFFSGNVASNPHA
uniref:Copper amine oxidase catalytic domain-containing protein n=1 Tax=Alexandrium catenella TaxID=2925 RepID=A0A7S1S4X5_ALECA|mmetsp:Transcript_85341/g.226564  ORF Transcript_85341/g.226564 Transcript_85341/m.226564 type:complete len:206 (+) Transcript_85341:66-683(+)